MLFLIMLILFAAALGIGIYLTVTASIFKIWFKVGLVLVLGCVLAAIAAFIVFSFNLIMILLI